MFKTVESNKGGMILERKVGGATRKSAATGRNYTQTLIKQICLSVTIFEDYSASELNNNSAQVDFAGRRKNCVEPIQRH